MNTYQTFYVSAAAKHIQSDEIHKIVSKANEFNSKNQITGILLFRAGIFLQLLEGEKVSIEALFQKIEMDPRHSNVIRIFSVENNERLFSNWSMGYHEVSDLDVKMVNEILSWNKLITAARELDNNIILHLLSRFKKIMLEGSPSASSAK